jgi:activator of 2-hydroxyglutaryl-CoA dehydratase
MMDGKISLGLDIGSISVNTVLVGPEGAVLVERYAWCHGRPFQVLSTEIAAILGGFPAATCSAACS